MFSDEWYLKHEKLIYRAGFTVILLAVYMLIAWQHPRSTFYLNIFIGAAGATGGKTHEKYTDSQYRRKGT